MTTRFAAQRPLSSTIVLLATKLVRMPSSSSQSFVSLSLSTSSSSLCSSLTTTSSYCSPSYRKFSPMTPPLILLLAVCSLALFSRTTNAASIFLKTDASGDTVATAVEDTDLATLQLLKGFIDKYPAIAIRPLSRLYDLQGVTRISPLAATFLDDSIDEEPTILVRQIDESSSLLQPSQEPTTSDDGTSPQKPRVQQAIRKRNNAEVVNHILKNFSNLGRLGDVGK